MNNLSNKWVTCKKDVMGGQPCIKGTRITVANILDMVACKVPTSEIIADFPSLTEEKISAALDYSAKMIRKSNIS